MMAVLSAKWDRIYGQADVCESLPAPVVSDNAFLLPKRGKALDLACGLGANACFLAAAGLEVEAWDVSAVALAKLEAFAVRERLPIHPQRLFIDANCLVGRRFDVIVVSRFLDRTLNHAIIKSLTPGGLLFYQTFTQTKVSDQGPANPDYLLAEQELLTLFAPLRILYYRDNGSVGDVAGGLRNEAQFIGQKRNETV